MALDREIDTLNMLRRAEASSLVLRLPELSVFLDPCAARHSAELGRLLAEEREHLPWLDALVLAQRGSLVPAGPDIRSADGHYLTWPALLPRLVADQRRLAGVFDSTAEAVSSSGSGPVIHRIADRHHQHADALLRMGQRQAVASP